jgi:hypothetical protein
MGNQEPSLAHKVVSDINQYLSVFDVYFNY